VVKVDYDSADRSEKYVEGKIKSHAREKIWLTHGFERFLWSKYGIYPSITGERINILKNSGNFKFHEKPLAFFHHKSFKVNNKFKTSLKKIKQHLTDKNKHASMLEFIITLALRAIQLELPDEFPIGPIEIEKPIGSFKLDAYIENAAYNKFAIEIKNPSGYIGLNYKKGDLKRKLDAYKSYKFTPILIAPFLSKEIQDYLISARGFFCNLGYNVTQYTDDELIDIFYEAGLGDTFIFYKLDEWETAADAKTWLREKLNKAEFEEVKKEIDKIFKDQRLNFILRKVRGIFKFASLSTLKDAFIQSSKLIETLSNIKLPKSFKEKIILLDEFYFRFLIDQEHKRRTAHSFVNILTNKSDYLKKLNRKDREDFVEDLLRTLQSFNYIKKTGRSYYAEDIETPYPSKMKIDLSSPDSQKI